MGLGEKRKTAEGQSTEQPLGLSQFPYRRHHGRTAAVTHSAVA